MYTKIFKFFNENNFFYPLPFGFRQKYCTAHAFKSILKHLNEGNFACGIFVYLQKGFDTVEHDILLPKFGHHALWC